MLTSYGRRGRCQLPQLTPAAETATNDEIYETAHIDRYSRCPTGFIVAEDA